jgi:arylsulfatase A-like enzyme
MKHRIPFIAAISTIILALCMAGQPALAAPPNILLIYADDIGYGDLGCYGATAVKTPAVDRLAREGLRFTDAHSNAATCTPSRYSLLTGEYAWRKKGTGILPGDAALIIEPGRTTLPSLLKRAGYATGVVGKWHLGLGTERGKQDWNGDIKPGPLEIGFDEAFIMPATGDRVPTVYVENHRVVGLDPADPIQVSYGAPFVGELDGITHRDQLRMNWSNGHNQAVHDGIGRIGYQKGGKAARWKDESMADDFTKRAVAFIEQHRAAPFFLYFATHGIHVPRVPHPRFVGQSGMGPRGDAIVEFDACVDALLQTLDRLGLADNTLVILSSDNGPVLDDGYADDAVAKLGTHKPAGPLRGGKATAFEGGTRVPFLVRWPARVKPGTSDALVGQIDLLASLAALTEQKLSDADAPDSFNILPTLLGESPTGRDHLVEQGVGQMVLRVGSWKYLPPSPGRPAAASKTPQPTPDQLYDLSTDLGEMNNLAPQQPERVQEMQKRLEQLRKIKRRRP